MRGLSIIAEESKMMHELANEIYLSRKAQEILPIMESNVDPIGIAKRTKKGRRWFADYYYFGTIKYIETAYFVLEKLSDFVWFNEDLKLSERNI